MNIRLVKMGLYKKEIIKSNSEEKEEVSTTAPVEEKKEEIKTETETKKEKRINFF